ncbi:unnamed protein product [Urochloa humidicola]
MVLTMMCPLMDSGTDYQWCARPSIGWFQQLYSGAIPHAAAAQLNKFAYNLSKYTECTRRSLRMHDDMLCNMIKENDAIYNIQKKRMISCILFKSIVICNATEPVTI